MTQVPDQAIRRAHSLATDVALAVREVAEQLPGTAACTLVFCTASHDLDALGPLLADAFDHPVVGCTTAGEIGPGRYTSRGLAAVSFSADAFTAVPLAIEPLSSRLEDGVVEAVARAQALTDRTEGDERVFGVLLVDGLSRREELLVAELFTRTAPFPLVGGSAGDDLRFAATRILHAGAFRSDRAVLVLFKTRLPFVPFQIQHHVVGDELLVVTRADPGQRRVHELNGELAAREYARAVGVSPGDLDPEIFSARALAVRVGDQEFLRSIQSVTPDGSLSFYCAIDRGVPLRVTRTLDPVATLRDRLDGLRAELGPSIAMLCFDCVLRKLEFERLGVLEHVGELLEGVRAVGFSTYGEQCNALHVNQTLVGIAFGQGSAA